MEEKIKTTVAKNKESNGSKYSYKYTDLAQIHEYLESIGARYYQYVDTINDNDYIMTVPIIDNKELPARRGVRIVNATLIGINNPAQEQGSATTYARRYSLLMAFGLATEDDDAGSLTRNKITTKEEAEKYVLTFGKYKDKTLNELISIDKNYVDWLFNNDKTDPTIKECITLITGEVAPTQAEQKEQLDLLVRFNELINKTKTDREKLYNHFGVENNTQMTPKQFREAISIMEMKLEG